MCERQGPQVIPWNLFDRGQVQLHQSLCLKGLCNATTLEKSRSTSLEFLYSPHPLIHGVVSAGPRTPTYLTDT